MMKFHYEMKGLELQSTQISFSEWLKIKLSIDRLWAEQEVIYINYSIQSQAATSG